MDHCDLEEDNYLGNKVFFLLGMNTKIGSGFSPSCYEFGLGYWEYEWLQD